MRIIMLFYFAPMEGITSYIYRNIHQELFDSVDKYFMPFISPTEMHGFKKKELRDILPEHNQNISVVPQILSNRADDFIYTAQKLIEYGYHEINLNLGCPSGTVVSKGRGSGFLAMLDELNRFLDHIYNKVPVPISIKTRLGKDNPEEFRTLIHIFNRFPILELTIHPRTQKDLYRNKPNWDQFEEALAASTNHVCYNGDINTVEDFEKFRLRFPSVERIMIGRGLLTNPGLVREIKTGEQITKQELLLFARRLQQDYQAIMPDNPVLLKMKEVWSYMKNSFPGSEKIWKKIKKSRKLTEYEAQLFILESGLDTPPAAPDGKSLEQLRESHFFD